MESNGFKVFAVLENFENWMADTMQIDKPLEKGPLGYKKVLTATALFEGTFSIDWIQTLTNLKSSQLLTSFEKGIENQIFKKEGPGLYSFRDLKTRERLLKSIAPEKKNQLHRLIAETLLEDLNGDNAAILEIASHLRYGKITLHECRLLFSAGEIERKAFHYQKASTYYQKIMDELKGVFSDYADELFIKTAIQQSKIAGPSDLDPEEVLENLHEAGRRAESGDRTGDLAVLEMQIAQVHWYCSLYVKSFEHYEKGRRLALSSGEASLLQSFEIFEIFYLFWQGRFREVVYKYEDFVPDIEKFPYGGFSLFAALSVGLSYVHIGHATQGLGMLDSVRNYFSKKGDHIHEWIAEMFIGSGLINSGEITGTLQFIKDFNLEKKIESTGWGRTWYLVFLIYAYYLANDMEKAELYLRKTVKTIRQSKVSANPHPSYFFPIFLAMEKGKLPRVVDFSFEEIIENSINEKNIFLKGVAYRYKAVEGRKKGLSSERILQLLGASRKWLKQSGHRTELAHTLTELAREYLRIGKNGSARANAKEAGEIFSYVNAKLIPEDIALLSKSFQSKEDLLKEIFTLGQELVTLRNSKDLVKRILFTSIRLCGAERGAIFILDKNVTPHFPTLRAAKNISEDELLSPDFQNVFEFIRETALSGKDTLLKMEPEKRDSGNSKEAFLSVICVPMKLRNEVMGVLYHDNRLFSSAFKESDLEILHYFASQAAIAMDNARAYEEIRSLNQKLVVENQYLEEQHLESIQQENIIGKSIQIKQVLSLVNQVAMTDTSVLISGETGVGKELVARSIHQNSKRCNAPFIRVNCSAFSENLIVSELFGHEKGSFTGADSRRIGRFEMANGGTLFLDEIGDVPMDVQVKLLRVLQSREFERVGGRETLTSDFRLLAATNRDLKKDIKAHHFREDLFYRLNVFPIDIPPLRERKEDIPLLAYYFLKIHSAKLSKNTETIAGGDMEKLIRYNWPGNVRELENLIERGTILSSGPVFKMPELDAVSLDDSEKNKFLSLEETERRQIIKALEMTKGKIRGEKGAAKLLDLHPNTLYSRMKKHGLKKQPITFS